MIGKGNAVKQDSFRDYVVDQLTKMTLVTPRPMFGGYGLYHKGAFFGIIADNQLYFKVCEDTVAAYREKGMEPFRPNKKQILKTFYQVPPDILEDEEQLIDWAEKAVESQLKA